MNSYKDEIFKFIDDASQELGSRYILNPEQREKIEKICDAVEQFIATYNCKLFDMHLNETTSNVIVNDNYGEDHIVQEVTNQQLQIEIVCDEILFPDYPEDEVFINLVQLTNSIAFAQRGEDNIGIRFNFDHFWQERKLGQ